MVIADRVVAARFSFLPHDWHGGYGSRRSPGRRRSFSARCEHFSDLQIQTAKLSRARGAMRPRFASPSRKVREGDGAAGGARVLARHPLRRGYPPTSRGTVKPRAPIDGGRCASRRSTFCQPASSADPGPRSGQLSLCPLQGSLLESAPSSDRTAAMISPVQGCGIRNLKKLFACFYRHISA